MHMTTTATDASKMFKTALAFSSTAQIVQRLFLASLRR